MCYSTHGYISLGYVSRGVKDTVWKVGRRRYCVLRASVTHGALVEVRTVYCVEVGSVAVEIIAWTSAKRWEVAGLVQVLHILISREGIRIVPYSWLGHVTLARSLILALVRSLILALHADTFMHLCLAFSVYKPILLRSREQCSAGVLTSRPWATCYRGQHAGSLL